MRNLEYEARNFGAMRQCKMQNAKCKINSFRHGYAVPPPSELEAEKAESRSSPPKIDTFMLDN